MRLSICNRKARLLSLVLVWFSGACWYTVPPPEPTPPVTPPPPPSPMNADEAVRHGLDYCRNHSLACQRKNAVLLGERTWKVDFDVPFESGPGQLHLEYDAFTRALLRASEYVPPPPPPPQAPPMMTAAEAREHAFEYCREHGYACQPVSEELGNDRIWRLVYDAERGPLRGHLELEYDALTRALVRVTEPRPPPPPPPPPPRKMSGEEAVARAESYCQSRGFVCRLLDQDFFEERIWRMNFEAQRGVLRGPLHIEFDALSGNMVNVREPSPPPPTAPTPMDYDEAVRHGLTYCRSRELHCELHNADLARGVWRIDFEIERHEHEHGHLHLEFDALSRALLDVHESLHER